MIEMNKNLFSYRFLIFVFPFYFYLSGLSLGILKFESYNSLASSGTEFVGRKISTTFGLNVHGKRI